MKKISKKTFEILIITLLLITFIFNTYSNAYEYAPDDIGEIYPFSVRVKKLARRAHRHLVCIDEEGYLWKYFSNAYETYMERVSTEVKFQDIVESTYGALALDVDGYLWECNTYLDNVTDEVIGTGTPLELTKVNNKKYKYIEAGYESFFAIDENDILWGWGKNEHAQLGNGELNNNGTADRVTDMRVIKSDIAQVSTGRYCTLAIDKSGYLWFWGGFYNVYDDVNEPLDLFAELASYTPKKILSSYKFSEISVGQGDALALDTSGNVWGWGDNEHGQLGQVETVSEVTTPTIIKSNISKIRACDYSYETLLLDKDGYVWVAGENYYGCLGTGDENNVYTFTKTIGNIKDIMLGYADTAFFMDNNNAIWGSGYIKPWFTGTATHVATPIQMTTYPNSYTITYELNGGTINSGKVESYVPGSKVTLPTDVTKTNYIFTGWYIDEECTGNVVTSIETNETGFKKYYAGWQEIQTANYTVQHYKQNTDLTNYTLTDTENKTGTVGAVAVPVAKTYTGFTKNSSKSDVNGTVLADGSLILEVYYDRNSYTVTLNTNSGTINSGNVTSYTYGVGASLPTDVTKAGYTFGGWYESSSFSGNAVTSISTTDVENKTYYAKWTQNTNTTYKVEHYKQNTTLDEYELVTEDTENLSRNNRYDCYSSGKNIYRLYRKYNI